MLLVLLLVSKAGAGCVGGLQELRSGEVLVMCPLSEDARLTRRGVVISHSSKHDQSIPDTMLGCDWLARHSHKPDCSSRFQFTLVSLKDCVMARVPREQLHKDGFYQIQLVPPPDEDHAFSRCLIYDNDDTDDPTTTLSPVITASDQPRPRDPMEKVLTDDTEDPSTTISPVIPSTADDLRHPGNDTDKVSTNGMVDPSTTISPVIPSTAGDLHHPWNDKEKVSTGADGGYPQGTFVAVLVLMVILLVANAGFFLFTFFLHRRYGRTVPRTSETSLEMEKQPMNRTTSTF